MSRKKRKSRRSRRSSSRSAGPAEREGASARTGRDDARSSGQRRPSRRRLRFVVAAVIGLGLVSATAAFFLDRDRPPTETAKGSGSTTTATPPEELAVEYPPDPLVPPTALRPPEDLTPPQREAARRALQLHRNALDAYFEKKDLQAFEQYAHQALTAYQTSGWLPPELSSFHNLYLATRHQHGDLRTTIVAGRKWLERFPDSLPHLQTVARAEYQASQYEQAAEHFRAYLQRRPRSLQTCRQLAAVYVALARKQEALEMIDRALSLIGFPREGYRERPGAFDTLKAALLTRHRFYEYEGLREVAEAILAQRPLYPDALMALGVAERHLGNYARAEELLEKYLDLTAPVGNLEEVLRELALARLKQKRPQEALQALVELLDHNPFLSKAYFHIGQCLSRLGHPERAEAMFAQSRTLAPAEREERRELEMRSTGRRAQAERARARALFLRGQLVEAERALREALQQSGGDPIVHTYLVEHLYETWQVTAGLRELKTLARRVGEDNAGIVGWRAILEARQGEARAAASNLARVCSRSSRDLGVWGLPLARLYLDDLREPAAAVRWLELLLEEGPNPRAQLLLARAHTDLGNLDEALETFATVSRQSEGWSEESAGLWLARAHLGSIVDGNEDEEAAAASLAAALEGLRSVPPSGRPKARYLETVALWLGHGGDPSRVAELGVLTGGDSPREPASAIAVETDRLATIEERVEKLKRQAARRSERELAETMLAIARELRSAGLRDESIQWAQRAHAAAPSSAIGLTELVAWHDRPEEAFLRWHYQKELAKRNSNLTVDTRAKLLDDLLASDAES